MLTLETNICQTKTEKGKKEFMKKYYYKEKIC